MSADPRLLNAIRRFWDRGKVETLYQAVTDAFYARLDDVTVIIGKSSEGEGATAQVVVAKDDYLEFMDVMETRLQEMDAADSGSSLPLAGTEHVSFGHRCVST